LPQRGGHKKCLEFGFIGKLAWVCEINNPEGFREHVLLTQISDFSICISKYGIDAIPAFAHYIIVCLCQQSSDVSISGGNPPQEHGRFST